MSLTPHRVRGAGLVPVRGASGPGAIRAGRHGPGAHRGPGLGAAHGRAAIGGRAASSTSAAAPPSGAAHVEWRCALALSNRSQVDPQLSRAYTTKRSSYARQAVMGSSPSPHASVPNVEGIAQSPIELRSLDLVEMACGCPIENTLRNGEDVVAVHDARLRQPLLVANLDFGADAANRPGDRCARDSAEHGDGGVTSQDTDRSPPCGRAKICPVHLAACYHAGEVSVASRRATSTIPGS